MTTTKYGKENYYASSIKNLIESSKQFNVEHFHIYTPEMLDIDDSTLQYMKDNHDPGFGFYMWKPLIILDVMKQINDGDVVLYHDAGRPEYDFNFKKDINNLVNRVIKDYGGVGVAQGGYPHHQYCKRDCFIEMDCNSDKYWNKKHLSATWSVWQKNDLALEILEQWKYYCSYPLKIISSNDTNGPISDFSDFVGHRHDQAILTNLIYKYQLKTDNVVRPLIGAFGWEKDINNFIDYNNDDDNPIFDYSLTKFPNVLTTSKNITTVIDIYYKNNKLFILTTGAIEDVFIVNGEDLISRNEKIHDPHINVHLFIFDIEYKNNIKIKLIGYKQTIDPPYAQFDIIKDYYGTYINEHIITVICNGFHNNVNSILTFVKYHINLGVDRIILHYREGNNIKEFYDVLRSYIEDEKVILLDWNGKIEFYQEIKKDESPVGLGEVAHMNHTLNIFKEAKYLTWLNIDQLLVPPKEIFNINNYLDYLVTNYNCADSGGFVFKTIDFKKPNSDLKYYESKEVVNNISIFPQLTYFIQNDKIISSHCVTLGPEPVKIPKEAISVNHYPFLDNNRSINGDVIEYLDNLNYNLFN
jgi:hypothetical protein